MHTGCPWLGFTQKDDGSVEVETPKGRMTFDYLICATGCARADLMAYNEKRLGFVAGARRGGLN
jgi:glycine/D-amino acid oxidase-like deaminating enzyme